MQALGSLQPLDALWTFRSGRSRVALLTALAGRTSGADPGRTHRAGRPGGARSRRAASPPAWPTDIDHPAAYVDQDGLEHGQVSVVEAVEDQLAHQPGVVRRGLLDDAASLARHHHPGAASVVGALLAVDEATGLHAAHVVREPAALPRQRRGQVARPLAAPVGLYALAIAAMMWRAAARVRPGERAGWIALAGALCFGLSDTLLAIHRFRSPVPGASYAIMLTYWAGQLGIAASAVRSR